MANSNGNILDELNSIEKSALAHAVALQKKAADNGFDWPNISGVIAKIQEELEEVHLELSQGNDPDRLEDELGDLLFACCNLARHLSLDPAQALQRCNNKFYRRFSHVEKRVTQQGKVMKQCKLSELDSYWDEAKLLEKSNSSDNNSKKSTKR